mgnify:CR=1 FL=1
MAKREFNIVFQLSKMKIFEVSFYTIKNNPTPHFSTSACLLSRNKKSYIRSGQAQKEVTIGFPEAYHFYEKWDKYHIHDLTRERYDEMISDLKVLMEKYNFVQYDHTYYVPFHMIVTLSKLKPKSEFKTKEKWEQYMEKLKAEAGKYDTIHSINVW